MRTSRAAGPILGAIITSLLATLLVACGTEPPADPPPAAVTTLPPIDPPVDLVDLIDPGIPPAIAGADGWEYFQVADADLNGDGVYERVVIMARVGMSRGRPMWDDGQAWQVYVEEGGTSDSTRTYLYSRRLQLGTLIMRVTEADSGTAATLVLIEHLPDRLSVFEASYEAPGRASVLERFARDVDPRGEIASPRLP